MLIYYYDLEGKPVMYKKPKGGQYEHLYRIRRENPALHLDKTGKPIKYQSPKGSGSHLYIPEKIRLLYKHKRKIKRLLYPGRRKES